MKKRALFVSVFVALLILFQDNSRAQPVAKSAQAARIYSTLSSLSARLGLSADFTVLIEEENPKAVSVKRGEAPNLFIISFERSFLQILDKEELTAALAHELGHVWIFLTHPFLQTEELANEVAASLVSQKSLDKVYQRVQERGKPAD